MISKITLRAMFGLLIHCIVCVMFVLCSPENPVYVNIGVWVSCVGSWYISYMSGKLGNAEFNAKYQNGT